MPLLLLKDNLIGTTVYDPLVGVALGPNGSPTLLLASSANSSTTYELPSDIYVISDSSLTPVYVDYSSNKNPQVYNQLNWGKNLARIDDSYVSIAWMKSNNQFVIKSTNVDTFRSDVVPIQTTELT
jgi:hypothetical protein